MRTLKQHNSFGAAFAPVLSLKIFALLLLLGSLLSIKLPLFSSSTASAQSPFKGTVWIVNSSDNIYRWNGPEFYQMAYGGIKSVSMGSRSSINPTPVNQYNAATYVSQSVPTSMIAGQTCNVSVTMQNSGTTTWTENTLHRLGSQNAQDNMTWGVQRAFLASSVGPGQNAIFNFTVTPPSAPGPYNFQWRMVQDTVEWFGASTPNIVVNVTTPPVNQYNAATYVSQSVPTTMIAGQSSNVSVTMQNSGTTTWTENTLHRLGSQNAQDNMTWGVQRAFLAGSVGPGQNAIFNFTVTPPSTPGPYNFQWRMVQDTVEWFGASTPNIVVNVTVTTASANHPPKTPSITEPYFEGATLNPYDVHMETEAFSDPDSGDTHTCSDWEIRVAAADELVWEARCVTEELKVHIHLADGGFLNSHAGRGALNFDTNYRLRVRHKDSSGNSLSEWSDWAQRGFRTASPIQCEAVPWKVMQDGYTVEEFAGGFRLPVNIAFVPNPTPNGPYFYVTELYGTIKVVKRDHTVSDYATGAVNYQTNQHFPGTGEQGLTGLVVDPVSGDVFASMLYLAPNRVDHYPKVVRFHSSDGGFTAASQTTILDMAGETEAQSHQISNLSFGPDNKLYVHNGDGFDSSKAPDMNSFRGKILRLNLDGTAPADNPFYGGGGLARNYIFALGFRNPFGGAWRAADQSHYEVENGPGHNDRLAKVVRGGDYGWHAVSGGMNEEDFMTTNAIYNWFNIVAPVNIAFIQGATFNGSGFPAEKWDHAFVAESGPTAALGPQTYTNSANGKRITEFILDGNGNLISGPTKVVEYRGCGRESVSALAAGPDGLYFSTLYPDDPMVPATAPGARILVVKPPSPPAVIMTAPTAGAQFTSPATINIDAAATAGNGRTITRVEFYQNGSLLGQAVYPISGNTYRFPWSNVGAGSYSLTAKVVDNAGAVAASTAVGITVLAPPPPPNINSVTDNNYSTTIYPSSTIIVWGSNFSNSGNRLEFQRSNYQTVSMSNGDGHLFYNSSGQINANLDNRLAAGQWNLVVKNAGGVASAAFSVTISSTPTPPVITTVTDGSYSSVIYPSSTIIVWGYNFSPGGGNTLQFQRPNYMDVWMYNGDGHSFYNSSGQINAGIDNRLAPGQWNLTVRNASGLASAAFAVNISSPPAITAVTDGGYSNTIYSSSTIIVWGNNFSPGGGNTLQFQRTGYASVWMYNGDGHSYWNYSTYQINAGIDNRLAPGQWSLTVRNASGVPSAPFAVNINSSGPLINAVTDSNYSYSIDRWSTIIIWGSGFSSGGNSVQLQRPNYADVWMYNGDGYNYWDYSSGQSNADLGYRAASGWWTVTVRDSSGRASQPFSIYVN